MTKKTETVEDFLKISPLERREMYRTQLYEAWCTCINAPPAWRCQRIRELFETITKIRDDGWCVYWTPQNVPYMP